MKTKTHYVYTDGETLFIAPHARKAREMFKTAFGGDTPRDHGVRLKKVSPRSRIVLYDRLQDREKRVTALVLARRCPGQTIMAE